MTRRTRTFFTDKQKSDIWDRWERGESMSSIGRLFERNFSSIIRCYPARAVSVRQSENVHLLL
uniref:hypothetical protein n=1 Tax=Hellea balneolensis TaxID=287478 RepID=UPI0012B6E26C|nr:hypothetical protein [Hellea balneolensis]